MKVKIEFGKNEVKELKDVIREFDVDEEDIAVADQDLYYDNGPLHFEGSNNMYEIQIGTELVVFVLNKFKWAIKICKSVFEIFKDMVSGIEEFFEDAEEVSKINGKSSDEYWKEIRNTKESKTDCE